MKHNFNNDVKNIIWERKVKRKFAILLYILMLILILF
jgi:hypothetical protein